MEAEKCQMVKKQGNSINFYGKSGAFYFEKKSGVLTLISELADVGWSSRLLKLNREQTKQLIGFLTEEGHEYEKS